MKNFPGGYAEASHRGGYAFAHIAIYEHQSLRGYYAKRDAEAILRDVRSFMKEL